MGLINDPDYCIKSDIYKLQHPESIYENFYVLIDFGGSELSREIMRDFAVDVMPHISESMPDH